MVKKGRLQQEIEDANKRQQFIGEMQGSILADRYGQKQMLSIISSDGLKQGCIQDTTGYSKVDSGVHRTLYSHLALRLCSTVDAARHEQFGTNK